MPAMYPPCPPRCTIDGPCTGSTSTWPTWIRLAGLATKCKKMPLISRRRRVVGSVDRSIRATTNCKMQDELSHLEWCQMYVSHNQSCIKRSSCQARSSSSFRPFAMYRADQNVIVNQHVIIYDKMYAILRHYSVFFFFFFFFPSRWIDAWRCIIDPAGRQPLFTKMYDGAEQSVLAACHARLFLGRDNQISKNGLCHGMPCQMPDVDAMLKMYLWKIKDVMAR